MIYFLAEDLDGKDGASRAAADCLHDLLHLGRPIVVVARHRSVLPPRADGERSPSVRWLLVPKADPPSRRGLGVFPWRWLWWARAMLEHVRRHRRAVALPRRFPPTLSIHNEFPYPGSLAHRVLHMAPHSMILVHSSRDGIEYYLRGRKTLTTQLVSRELASVEGLMFVSPQLRDDWAGAADLAHVRQWVLSNTCREDEAAAVLPVDRGALRAGVGLAPDRFVAACVGYVHDGKGQDVLVAALPAMVRAVPNLLVVFVGDDRSEWAGHLKSTIRELGLSDHVLFTGLRPDPYAFIRASDLLIHPSRAEGQGLVLLEAMLLQTPVLASNVGGIPSVVTHEETGWLVPPGDPDALLDGFTRLARDAELRRTLAAQAERVYWSRFQRAEHRRRFLEIVDEMTNVGLNPS